MEADARMWPLGKPAGYSEPPLWQEICKMWTRDIVRPYHVTRLIEELDSLGDAADGESTAWDIRQALDVAADWEAVAVRQGWKQTEDLIDTLQSPGSHTELLSQLLNLATQEVVDKAFAPMTDIQFYWLRKVPGWDGDVVTSSNELLPWRAMTVEEAARREGVDGAVRKLTELAVDYTLGWVEESYREEVSPRHSDHWDRVIGGELPGECSCLAQLPESHFVSMGTLLEVCPEAVTAWVIAEYLEPNGFVNLEEATWSELTDWKALGEREGYQDRIEVPEVSAWYIVSEFAGRHLRELGEAVVEPEGTGLSIWGRVTSGQYIHCDGCMTDAMIRYGYLKHVPPLGALSSCPTPPSIQVSLGGEEFPFSIYGGSEHRTAGELAAVLIRPDHRERGWAVEWGPTRTHVTHGPTRTFKLVVWT